MVSHIAATLFTAIVLYSAVPGSSLFSWHPTLMTIAFVLLMFESIIIFSPESSLILSWSHSLKANIHGYVMAVASCFALGGFITIYYNKELKEKPHFTSWHGLMGILSLIYICLQTFGGIFLKYNRILSNALNIHIRLVDLKLYHATSGLVAFTMVSATLLLGIWSTWFIEQTNEIVWYVSFACLSCISMMVMMQITTAYLPKSKQPLTMANNIAGRNQRVTPQRSSRREKKKRH